MAGTIRTFWIVEYYPKNMAGATMRQSILREKTGMEYDGKIKAVFTLKEHAEHLMRQLKMSGGK